MPNDFTDPTDDLYDAVAAAESERAHDAAQGCARFGVLETPNYLGSYLRAARVLVNSGQAANDLNTVAVPCLYLQRHALELAIKGVISLFHDVASTAPLSQEIERLTSSHTLKDLLGDLETAHRREAEAGHIYPAAPPDLARLVDEMSRLEDGAPDRFRYDAVKRGKGKSKRLDPSFNLLSETVLPVEPTQSRLEDLISRLSTGDDSLVYQLDIASRAADQERYGEAYHSANIEHSPR